MKKIKLSKKQKTIIDSLHKGEKLMWLYTPQKYFIKTFMGNFFVVLDSTAHKLILNKIIIESPNNTYNVRQYELTELGKTIEI